ncbi:MAG: lipopolysaccharide biosynthesis protein [Acidimicrobiales bacterium]
MLVAQGTRTLVIVGVGMLVSTLSRLAISITAAHVLDQTEAGQYLTAFAVMTVGCVLLRLGLDQNAVRLIARKANTGPSSSTVVRSSSLILGVTSAVVIALGLAGGTMFGFNTIMHQGVTYRQGAYIVLWLVAEAVRLVFSESLRGHGRTVSATVFGDSGRFLVLACAIVGLGVGREASLDSLLAVSCFTAVGWLVLAAGRLAWIQHSVRSSGSLAVGLILRGTFAIYVTGVCTSVISQGDTVVVGSTLSHLSSAIYVNASRISLLLLLPLSVVNLALSPTLAQSLGTERQPRVEERVRLVVTAATAIAVVSYLLVLVGAPLFVHTAFPPDYARVAPLTAVLALGPMATTSTGPNGLSLVMGGRARVAAWAMGTVSAVQVALMVAAAHLFGIFGVAAVSSGGSIAQNVYLAYLARRELGIRTEAFFSPVSLRKALASLG